MRIARGLVLGNIGRLAGIGILEQSDKTRVGGAVGGKISFLSMGETLFIKGQVCSTEKA